MSSSEGLVNSFLAAIQASLSVLLVIGYGAISGYVGLLDAPSAKKISKICVRLFLPALLFVDIGSQLHVESARQYGIIVLYALLCHFVSFLIGVVAHLGLGMPDWITPGLMFNNSTSYPLLLVDALDQTGILKNLVVAGDNTTDALKRARSYFLVYATVSSCLTFAVGPRLIDSEHAPEPDKDGAYDRFVEDDGNATANETTGLLGGRPEGLAPPNTFFPSRRPSVNPAAINRRASVVPKSRWERLNPRVKWWLLFISDFFNSSMLGAVAGAIVGLIPALHRAFFSHTSDGGIFTAWLTASFRSIGSLFVPLPLLIAGVSLYLSVKKARTSGQVAPLPWGTTAVILIVRFVVWPVLSISVIRLIATRSDFLSRDPILWFAMMLMPTGPTAIKLINMIQISDAGEEEEHMIAKLLTVSYLISPVLSFTVVASLRASEAAIHS